MILILVLLAPAAHAQPELNVALKGGLNAATLAEEHRINRYGVAGGLFGHVRWPLLDRLSLGVQTDLLYMPRGTRVFFEGEYLDRFRQHYLDITIAARPEVRLGPATVYLVLGGGLSFLLSASKENASGVKQDTTDGLRKIDVPLLIGGGVALHLPPRELGPFRLGTVFLDARHDRGLIDTDAVVGGFKNRTSSLMFGLAFAVGAREGKIPPAALPTPGDLPAAAAPY